MDDEYQWTGVAAILGIFILITAVVVMLIWRRTATARAQASLSREEEYRSLSEEGIDMQRDMVRQLREVTERIGEMQTRVDEVERILKDTE